MTLPSSVAVGPIEDARGPAAAESMRFLLRCMTRAREGDKREHVLFRQGKGWFQMGAAGHEAIAAIHSWLRPDDYVYPHYRDRALMLARGVTNRDLALAYLGRQGSSSEGRQMPAHYSSRPHHVVSLASPTAMQCLPAAGTAWACKLEGAGRITVCCLGDASTRQGEFYEALAFAVQELLPLVVIVEDNGYGISTPTARHNPWNLSVFGMAHAQRVDGRDTFAISSAFGCAAARARSHGGPTVLIFELDRLMPHASSDDHALYRTSAELAAMAARDPITRLEDALAASGDLDREAWQSEVHDIAAEIDRDYLAAEQSPTPDPAGVTTHLFAAAGPPVPVAAAPAPAATTIVAVVNDTLRDLLRGDERTLIFGEDVEDRKGGVFGLTKGLSTMFPGRVVNSPLAEATIAGTAAGLAIAGWKPIFELQFIDFVGPAFNQIVNQIATLRWRSAGAWECPLILMAPCGGFFSGGGPWHTQTNESWFAHAPGIRVVMPSTPGDAAALLRAAAAGRDPVLFMIPKHLLRQRHSDAADASAAIGRAAIRRQGEHVTVVAWGNCVDIAMEAARTAAPRGVSAEVIDLRSIVPCDWDTIDASVRRTHRLVVVQEDARTASIGQAIVAEVTMRCWRSLASPPILIARPDVHVPFEPALWQSLLPSPASVLDAITETARLEDTPCACTR